MVLRIGYASRHFLDLEDKTIFRKKDYPINPVKGTHLFNISHKYHRMNV
ncbi:MAG: hypothetical protein ACTSVZ_13260 [Promethearchaeota archaeon]